MTSNVRVSAIHTAITWTDGSSMELPNLWLRDNCDCSECRVVQTSEKKFIISSVAADLRPCDAAFDNNKLALTWPDGHKTQFSSQQIRQYIHIQEPDIELWQGDYCPGRVDYNDFLNNDEAAAKAIRGFLKTGALVITSMPGHSGTVENLQPRLGSIREMPFGRLHEVLVDPAGYNVAHTALPLPPHNDFASTNWPPSIQALHMLVNECEGGESVIVDGWSVAELLRTERPDYFEVLCKVPVPFRMFNKNEETFAANPLIRLDSQGAIIHFRYSNQLMQPLNPLSDNVAEFYQAYHELTRRLTSPEAKAVFRLESEHCLLVAGHRVLHAREAFIPSGRRHLQDAYFEHDCCRNHLTVIQRTLETQA